MAAMNPSRGLGRADTLRMEQRLRRRSSPLQSLSMRAFGRPQGDHPADCRIIPA
jgi:hypothetical protein